MPAAFSGGSTFFSGIFARRLAGKSRDSDPDQIGPGTPGTHVALGPADHRACLWHPFLTRIRRPRVSRPLPSPGLLALAVALALGVSVAPPQDVKKSYTAPQPRVARTYHEGKGLPQAGTKGPK